MYLVSNILYKKFNKAIFEYIQNYGIYVNGLMSTLLGIKVFYFGNRIKKFKEKITLTYQLDKKIIINLQKYMELWIFL